MKIKVGFYKKFLLFLYALLVFLDWATKFIVKNTFFYGESREVLGNFFRLTYVENPYSLFSISLGKNFPYVWFSLVVLLIIFAMFLVENNRWHTFIYTLFMAGATGNMIDRIKYDRVVDFFDFGLSNNLRWPVFNFADSYITIGMVLLVLSIIIDMLKHRKREKKEEVIEAETVENKEQENE